jgi:eukaryotic-like serine/threonine-protein kinase
VLDFGISKVSSADQSLSLTKTQTAMGSPLYMSPEQMRSARTVDSRTDIWSLGIVMFEILTGRVPFTADSMPELCARVLEDLPPNPAELRPEVPAGFAAAVLRCLEKEADKRYRDVGELANALVPFAGEYGRASTGRASRILEGAGLGKTVSEIQPRKSLTDAVPTDAETKVPTSHAFGRTDGTPVPAAKERKLGLIALGGVAAVVLGWLALRPGPKDSDENARAATAQSAPSTVSHAATQAAAALTLAPTATPILSASASAPALSASSPSASPATSLGGPDLPKPKSKASKPGTGPKLNKPPAGTAKPSEDDVFEERH